VNSKQVVAAVSVVALLLIIVYPALSVGAVSVLVRSAKIEKAEHIYVTVNDVWAHKAGQGSSEGWEMVSNQTKTIDLIALGNSTTTLGKGDISLARYDIIRIEVSNVTWVFNKTTTKLEVESSQLPTNVDFTVRAGKEAVITLTLGGRREETQGSRFFVPTLNATIAET